MLKILKFQRLKKLKRHSGKKITIFLTEFSQFGMRLALYKCGEKNPAAEHRISENDIRKSQIDCRSGSILR